MLNSDSSKMLSNPMSVLLDSDSSIKEVEKDLKTSVSSSSGYALLIQQVTGYSYTDTQVASQLAQVGILANLAYAFPYLDYVALLAGAVIVVLAIATLYVASAVIINDYMLTYYAYSGVNLTAAKQNTQAIVATYNNGARYWRAFLATSTFTGGFSNPEAHRGNGKALNFQHIHAITGYNGSVPQHGACHIFFAIPVIA